MHLCVCLLILPHFDCILTVSLLMEELSAALNSIGVKVEDSKLRLVYEAFDKQGSCIFDLFLLYFWLIVLHFRSFLQ